MTKTWPKVILDPVHNLIPFEDNPTDRLLLDLINAREFQRDQRSRWSGIGDHDAPESMIRMKRNQRSGWIGTGDQDGPEPSPEPRLTLMHDVEALDYRCRTDQVSETRCDKKYRAALLSGASSYDRNHES
jgi:hypothetical protein